MKGERDEGMGGKSTCDSLRKKHPFTTKSMFQVRPKITAKCTHNQSFLYAVGIYNL